MIGFALAALVALAVIAATSFWFMHQYKRTPSFKLTPEERQKAVLSLVTDRNVWIQVGQAIIVLLVLALLAVAFVTDAVG